MTMNETIRYSVICLAVLLFYISFAYGQKRAYATAQITATVVAALPAEMSLSVDKSGDINPIKPQVVTLQVKTTDVIAVEIKDGKKDGGSSFVLQSGDSQKFILYATAGIGVVRFSYLSY
jgi:hypothetical protein